MLIIKKIIYLSLGLIICGGAVSLWQTVGYEIPDAMKIIWQNGGVASAIDVSGRSSGQWACLWVVAYGLTLLGGKMIANGCVLAKTR
jgi:hypothetical protein